MRATIRREQEQDIPAIREVTIQAFLQSEMGYHAEDEIVDRLRDGCSELLSLVAVQEDRVVGHILFSPVVIASETQSQVGMGLAPLSILPGYQRQGIGTHLVNQGLRLLSEQNCPFVVVLGHPDYYAKFGFETARQFGITCEFDGVPEEAFRIKWLKAPSTVLPGGMARYCPEFLAD